jgi:polyisoprenoid-binding protein YceI
VDTASISTGDNDKGARPRARDEHLRTADFFNVAEFPRMTFQSSGVKFAGDNPAEIAGNLTLLGVTRPVAFQGRALGVQGHPMTRSRSAAATPPDAEAIRLRHEVRPAEPRRRSQAVSQFRGLQGLIC